MCYRALTCNVEIYGYIFLSCGNERKIKISNSLVVQKKKEKSTGTFGMYFLCFGPFWVWGMTLVARNHRHNKKLCVLMWCPAGEKKIVHYFGLDQDKANRTWSWHGDEKNKRVFNLVDGCLNPSSFSLNLVAIFLHLHSGKSHRC